MISGHVVIVLMTEWLSCSYLNPISHRQISLTAVIPQDILLSLKSSKIVKHLESKTRLSVTDATIVCHIAPTGLAHFPGCPVVKNPPCNAGDVGLTLGWRTKILHAMEQIEPTSCKHRTHEPQLENSCVTTEGHKTKTRCTQINFLSAKFINFVMSGFFF